MNNDIWKILLPAIFTLIGVLLGNYLTYKNSYNLFTRQKIFENQRISFARIMSLKIPWTQSIRTHIEAKLLSEFYERRYQLFSHDASDLTETKRQYDRALLLIKDISSQQKEVFETLGLIQTCFKMNQELQAAVDDLFNYQSLDVQPYSTNFNNLTELDIYHKKMSDQIEPLLKKEYYDKFDKLIHLMKQQLS